MRMRKLEGAGLIQSRASACVALLEGNAWADPTGNVKHKKGADHPAMSLQALYAEIEANYTIAHTSAIVRKFWYVPPSACTLYLALIVLGRKWMSSRQPYKLRAVLALWNLSLAVFSTIGFVVLAPDLLRHAWRDLPDSICNTAIYNKPLLSFFCLLFVFSKLVEFGDTFFIVVRKTPLNFLHWYHHVTVCLLSWHSLAIASAPGHWYSAMNFGVHSIMYSYYLLKASGVRVPSFVAQAITVLQLVQFFAGISVTLAALKFYISGRPCHTNSNELVAATTIYGSYFVLFVNFFYQRYCVKKTSREKME